MKLADLIPTAIASNGKGMTTHFVTIEEHVPTTLSRDERVQRTVRDARVRELTRNLVLHGVGVITLSERSDDRLVVIDGQHRLLAMIAAGHGDHPVTCHVYHGLTIAEEAELFRLLNNTARPTAMDDYLKGVLAGDQECLAIDSIVQRNGYHVALHSGAGAIACVDALRWVYRQKPNQPGLGPSALAFALHTATGAWGCHSDSVDGHIVRGLGQMYVTHGEEIDRDALMRKLTKFGSPVHLVGKAKGRREGQVNKTIGYCVALVVTDLYNTSRSKGRLTP